MAAMPSRNAKTPSTNPLDAAPATEPQYCVGPIAFSAVARILLLGSTGFVGRGVAHKILDVGHQLRVLVRDPMKAAAFKVRGAQVVVGDALDPASVTQAAQGVEHIISLVAVRRNRPQSYLAVNVDGPRIVGAVSRPELLGHIVELGGPEVVTYETIFDWFLQARKIKKAKLKLPVPLLAIPATAMEALSPNPPITPDEVRMIQIDNLAAGIDSVSSQFGWRPTAPSSWAPVNWVKRARPGR